MTNGASDSSDIESPPQPLRRQKQEGRHTLSCCWGKKKALIEITEVLEKRCDEEVFGEHSRIF